MDKVELKRKIQHPDVKKNSIQWSSCLPFIENKRGLLVHRPKSVTTHTLFKKPHISIEYMCGCMATGTDKFTFSASPPNDSIVCHRCEEKALEAGMQSSSNLVGRHVHLGGMKAYTTCGCNIPERKSTE